MVSLVHLIRKEVRAMPVVMKDTASKLTAILEPAEGKFIASCPELDLCTEGETAEEALEDLIDMAVDYAEHYMQEFDRYSTSPNRAGHFPYIQALHAASSRETARRLFVS